MDLQLAGEEIGGFGQDVVILANPNDSTSPFQSRQCLIQERKIARIQSKGPGYTCGLEWLAFQQR